MNDRPSTGCVDHSGCTFINAAICEAAICCRRFRNSVGRVVSNGNYGLTRERVEPHQCYVEILFRLVTILGWLTQCQGLRRGPFIECVDCQCSKERAKSVSAPIKRYGAARESAKKTPKRSVRLFIISLFLSARFPSTLCADGQIENYLPVFIAIGSEESGRQECPRRGDSMVTHACAPHDIQSKGLIYWRARRDSNSRPPGS